MSFHRLIRIALQYAALYHGQRSLSPHKMLRSLLGRKNVPNGLMFCGRNWKKRKGIASVESESATGLAEVHWYECHGVGKVKLKVKRWL